MTITVTVEELRAYEDAMTRWGAERAVAVAKAVPYYRSPGGFESTRDEEAMGRFVEKWDKENPPPRLIPKV